MLIKKTVGTALIFGIILILVMIGLVLAPTQQTLAQEVDSGCLACHEGLADIREAGSVMLATLKAKGLEAGDPEGCVICHGGNPSETEDEAQAHQGAPDSAEAEGFYPDPGSIWIADQTCGQAGCHPDKPYALERSLMNTEAGKIQGNMYTWTVQKDNKVVWGNYDVDDPDGLTPIFGSEAYKAYIVAMANENTDQFPTELEQLPNPSLEDVLEDPFMAGFTYQRQQCQRCHVGIRGRQKRGDYRGMGCSSCHIPYSNEGLYEGNDDSIPTDQPGRLLIH
ncbi:cytochrome C, partial [Chloroflexota bacterium]